MRKTLLKVLLAVSVAVVPVPAMAGESCKMNMEIADALFSVVGDIGVPVQFSDIGCTVLMRDEMCAMEQIGFDESAVVKDFSTGEETPMSTAYFVVASGVETPLGSGVIAFANRDSAEKFVSDMGKGEVMDYADFILSKVDLIRGVDKARERL
ncbi:MAG: nitrous oxide reductase accessory protein NosL [Thermodesulfovibrionales bacterium]|nr:nitrous oxide reductase accessory protein NosL [Thermodesulfovibrionales bacterium]